MNKSLAYQQFHLCNMIDLTFNSNYVHLTAFFLRTTWVNRHQKGKPFWILLKQEMTSGSDISWTICKSFSPRSRQITMPVPHHSDFYRPDAFPAIWPTATKHWRQTTFNNKNWLKDNLSTAGTFDVRVVQTYKFYQHNQKKIVNNLPMHHSPNFCEQFAMNS